MPYGKRDYTPRVSKLCELNFIPTGVYVGMHYNLYVNRSCNTFLQNNFFFYKYHNNNVSINNNYNRHLLNIFLIQFLFEHLLLKLGM